MHIYTLLKSIPFPTVYVIRLDEFLKIEKG